MKVINTIETDRFTDQTERIIYETDIVRYTGQSGI